MGQIMFMLYFLTFVFLIIAYIYLKYHSTRLEYAVIYSITEAICTNEKTLDKFVIVIDVKDLGITERKEKIYNSIFNKYPIKLIQSHVLYRFLYIIDFLNLDY